MTKDNRTIDVRIASALTNGEGTAAVVSDLLLAIDAAIPQTIKALEHARIQMLSPVNPDPAKDKAVVDKVELELQRLQAAVPALQQRYRQLTTQEHSAEWNADYAMVERVRDKLAKELTETYPPMVTKLIDLFKRIAACDKNVDIINSTAPAGDSRRLKGVELTARDIDHFSATQPSLAKTVQLPHPGQTCQLAWPPTDHSFAVQAGDMVYNAMAARSAAYSPDWHEAKKLDDAKKLADWARRNKLLEEQQEAAKREYVEAQHRASRGERN